MREEPLRVVVRRGRQIESVHAVHAAFVDEGGKARGLFGDAETRAFWRSSMKPFQALSLVEDGAVEAFDLTDEDLAICCASHYGTPRHVARVRSILERLDLGEADLACGAHLPFDEASAHALLREGGEARPVHNNCSGKHAGMLSLARLHGWPTEGYVAWDHPIQARVRAGLWRWLDSDPDRLSWAPDGCGVPTPHLSLREMASAYARLSRDPAAQPVVRAMTSHPELTSGPGVLVAEVMTVTGGRILAKEGAEGVLCLAGVADGWGIALKVADGGKRVVGPAVLTMLDELGLLEPPEMAELESLRGPPVLDMEGRSVGTIEADSRRPAVASLPGE